MARTSITAEVSGDGKVVVCLSDLDGETAALKTAAQAAASAAVVAAALLSAFGWARHPAADAPRGHSSDSDTSRA